MTGSQSRAEVDPAVKKNELLGNDLVSNGGEHFLNAAAFAYENLSFDEGVNLFLQIPCLHGQLC